MNKNNTRAAIAACIGFSLVRTAAADVSIAGARAAISEADPRRVEVYFELRNDTTHELELLKAESARADVVEYKQRSISADNVARLWPLGKFEVPAGGRLTLKADGRFFMLSGFEGALTVGQPISLTLTFEDEPPVTFELRLEAARHR